MLDSFSKIQNIWESSVNKNQQNGEKTEQFKYEFIQTMWKIVIMLP